MMDGHFRLIDEVSFSVLGTFDSQGEAVDSVAALLSVNDDDFLDELTIATDDGPLLYGDSLREALRNRQAVRSGGPSGDSNGGGDKPPAEALAATRDFSTRSGS